MKKRDAIEAVRKALSKHGKRSGRVRVNIIGNAPGETPAPIPAPEPRAPEFEMSGWQFFAMTGAWDDEPMDQGDADFRAPDGEYVGLVWDATGSSDFHFDFTFLLKVMLYVSIPVAVSEWYELRDQIAPLMAQIDAEYRAHRAKASGGSK